MKVEEICCYLPYKITAEVEGTGEMYPITCVTSGGYVEYYAGNNGREMATLSEIKLVLKHLSQIDKHILMRFNFVRRPTKDDDFGLFSWEFIQYCFENHFDVFGLIEKGEAVDVNSL